MHSGWRSAEIFFCSVFTCSELLASSVQHTENPSSPCLSQENIKDTFMESWEAYKRDAFGHDILMPVTHYHQDWVPGGMGLTLIDAMDGLWLLGQYEEFYLVCTVLPFFLSSSPFARLLLHCGVFHQGPRLESHASGLCLFKPP